MVRCQRFWIGLATIGIITAAMAQAQDSVPVQAEESVVDKERDLMTRTLVSVLHADGESHAAEMKSDPIFRYGDEPQKIGDSTIWVWMDEGRPVALQKIEVNKYFKPAGWTYCFTALSDERVSVQWPNVRRTYSSQRPVKFQAIPDAPEPGEKPRWRLQSRSLARQFTASMGQKKKTQQLRLLPNPIFTYQSETRGISFGAIYSLATGTNPSVLLLIELRETDEESRWYYGSARVTSAPIRLLHQDQEVRAEGPEWKPGQFPTWTYLWMGG